MTRESASNPERDAIDGVFRESYGQAVATLIRIFGDIAIAENAVQEAFAVASDRWRRDGIPPNPAGWIMLRSTSNLTGPTTLDPMPYWWAFRQQSSILTSTLPGRIPR